MSKRTQKQLDQLVRKQRLRHLMIIIVLPGMVLLGIFAWLIYVSGPQDPLSRTYFSAKVVSVEDISSGTGVAIEIVARFSGLQKIFQTDNRLIVDSIEDVVCIMETRGVRVAEDAPRPRYHALAEPGKCNLL